MNLKSVLIIAQIFILKTYSQSISDPEYGQIDLTEDYYESSYDAVSAYLNGQWYMIKRPDTYTYTDGYTYDYVDQTTGDAICESFNGKYSEMEYQSYSSCSYFIMDSYSYYSSYKDYINKQYIYEVSCSSEDDDIGDCTFTQYTYDSYYHYCVTIDCKDNSPYRFFKSSFFIAICVIFMVWMVFAIGYNLYHNKQVRDKDAGYTQQAQVQQITLDQFQ